MKLTLPHYFKAIWHASHGRRLEVARKLPHAFSPSLPNGTTYDCEINRLAEYEAGYARLAALLGRAGKIPPPDEIKFLHAIHHRAIHYSGTISSRDYLFLTAFVSILAPRRAIEIGTLTGFSAAIIAAAIRRQHVDETEVCVETIDLHPRYLVDTTLPVGFEIPILIPQLASAVRVHLLRESNFVAELAARDELEFGFIDADHQHPCPLLDVVRLAPYIRSGGWIVLHDIRLGSIGSSKVRDPGESAYVAYPFGAEWLFNEWPFDKIAGGNIGAIRIPRDKANIVPIAFTLMERPFEMSRASHKRYRHALYRSLTELI